MTFLEVKAGICDINTDPFSWRPHMKIFIDSADLDEITQGFAWGVVDGVTTNPSLLKMAVEKRIK